MRTTLAIDDDVLYAAKEIARVENRTAGAIISEVFRAGLARSQSTDALTERDRTLARLGVERFGSPQTAVTTDDVNRIREDLGL